MSGIEVAMGVNTTTLPIAGEFARILTRLADEQKIVKFYAEHVTVENAAWIDRIAKETLMKPSQITSALTDACDSRCCDREPDNQANNADHLTANLCPFVE